MHLQKQARAAGGNGRPAHRRGERLATGSYPVSPGPPGAGPCAPPFPLAQGPRGRRGLSVLGGMTVQCRISLRLMTSPVGFGRCVLSFVKSVSLQSARLTISPS